MNTINEMMNKENKKDTRLQTTGYRPEVVTVKPVACGLMPVAFFILVLLMCACASSKAERKKSEPVERYRVALFNAGVLQSVGDQAAMDLQGFREIHLVTGSELDSVLINANVSTRTLVEAKSFDELAKVQSLDFALVLLPAPPAYVMGSVGLRSVNWRTKSIYAVPAVKVPERSTDWLLAAKNGWARFTSDPPGASVTLNDKPMGQTPILAMIDMVRFRATFQWTQKYSSVLEVNLDDRNWIHARAPDEYLAKFEKKGWYSSLQEADEKLGEPMFIVFYVIVMIAGVAMLFIYPIK